MVKNKFKKILVIDDDLLITKILELRILKERGFDIIVAADASEGFRKAIDEKPDVIILDILLPQKDGFDILSKLKSEPATRNTPIIISSAIGDEEYIKKGLALGAKTYVVKGKISLDALFDQIKNVL